MDQLLKLLRNIGQGIVDEIRLLNKSILESKNKDEFILKEIEEIKKTKEVFLTDQLKQIEVVQIKGKDADEKNIEKNILNVITPQIPKEERIIENVSKKLPTTESIVDLVLSKIPTPEDGKTPTRQELISLIKPLIPKLPEQQKIDIELIIKQVLARLPDQENDSADEIKKKLESLSGEARLDASAIKNLPSAKITRGGAGGIKTFKALTDTPSTYIDQAGKFVVVKSNETGLEFTSVVPGGGVEWGNITGDIQNQTDLKNALDEKFDDAKNSIEEDAGALQLVGDEDAPGNNKVYGTDGSGNKGWKNDPAGGAGLQLLTATGTVDDSNTSFTFSEEPLMININGALYPKETGVYSWVWSADTATLAVPIGTGSFIVGVK